MMPSPDHPSHAAARKEAAALLRQLRGSDPAECAELVGWAHMLMPDRPAVQRLHIDTLLALGHADEAAAFVERALAERPGRLGLRMRRIQCLHAMDRLHEAAAEALFLAQARPNHVETLCAAADAMTAVGHHRRTREYLLRAIQHGSASAAIIPAMVERLVDAGLPDAASDVIERIVNPPVWLRARVLVAAGRLCDALVLLESDQALRDRDDRTHVLRLQLMARMGDLRLLFEHASHGGGDEHAVVAGECLLAAGSPGSAIESFRTGLHAPGALGVRARAGVMAALAVMGRARTALRLAGFLHFIHRDSADHAITANAWLRAFRGRLVSLNSMGRHPGRDPATSVLQPLIRRAEECFSRALEGTFQDTVTRDAVVSMRDRCTAALGADAGSPMTTAAARHRVSPSIHRLTLATTPCLPVDSPPISETPVSLRAAA